jgi:hypothetical protein
MNKMNCDIIQDLIPSYVDGICSDATKECVKEHVEECNKCRKLVEIYRDTEISDRNVEQKQIDGFKKFHSQIKLMNLFSLVLVFLLIGLGTYTFCTNFISLSTIIYYVLFPICMIGLYLYMGKKGNMKRAEKKDYIVAALSIIDTICAIGFMLYAMNCIINGKKVFSMEKAQLGPFINIVWGILFLLLVIGFVYLLLRMIRNNINNKWMVCLQMMGMFLLLAYVTLLSDLTSNEGFYAKFNQITVVIGTMGLAGVIVFAVIRHEGE